MTNMNCYFEHITRALESVSTDYIIESNSSNRLAERIFAYEFYHQFRLIMEKNESLYKGLYLAGEQSKIYEIRHGETAKDTPDIVLCGNMNEIGGKQEILFEIKMMGNSAWPDDLKKLSEFANSSLAFKYHVFIYVGERLSAIKQEVINTCGSVSSIKKNIFVINCFPDKDKNEVEINTIKDLI